jgi:hypothetical protein
MTRFDVMMGKENNSAEEKSKFILELDENDDVLKCIKQGMLDNNIKEASVKAITGKLISGLINAKEGRTRVEDAELINAKGKFKFGGDELWGSMEVFTEGIKPIVGPLLQGKAAQGLTITFEY